MKSELWSTLLERRRPKRNRRRLAVQIGYGAKGIYGAWSWRGLTAFIAGVLAEIPFVVLPFLVYIGLTRSLDVSRELELIHSHPELADPGSIDDVAESVADDEKRPTAGGNEGGPPRS